MWWSAFLCAALAADSGFYHPDDLAEASESFAQASEKAGSAFQEIQQKTQQMAAALQDYREALDLLGDRAPAAERDRLTALERQFNRQRATLGAFLDTLLEDFDTEFTAARDRALASLSHREVTVCARTLVEGPRVPGMRPRTRENPECTGDDLNQTLAAKMDADPILRGALTEILALSWPPLDQPSEPQPPVGEATGWIDVGALFRRGAAEPLKQIDRQDDEARLPFQAALESSDDPAQLAEHLEAARQVTAQTAQRRAALAEPVLQAAERRLPRLAESPVGWCANPPAWGGCTGTNATEPLVTALLEDRRVRRALR